MSRLSDISDVSVGPEAEIRERRRVKLLAVISIIILVLCLCITIGLVFLFIILYLSSRNSNLNALSSCRIVNQNGCVNKYTYEKFKRENCDLEEGEDVQTSLTTISSKPLEDEEYCFSVSSGSMWIPSMAKNFMTPPPSSTRETVEDFSILFLTGESSLEDFIERMSIGFEKVEIDADDKIDDHSRKRERSSFDDESPDDLHDYGSPRYDQREDLNEYRCYGYCVPHQIYPKIKFATFDADIKAVNLYDAKLVCVDALQLACKQVKSLMRKYKVKKYKKRE